MKQRVLIAGLCALVLSGCMHAQGQNSAQGKSADPASFPTTTLLGLGQVAAGAAMMASASGKNSAKAAVRHNIGAATLGSGITAVTMDMAQGLFRNARLPQSGGQALGRGTTAASALVPRTGMGGMVANRMVQGVGAAAITGGGRGREYANLPKTRQCSAYVRARESFQDMQMNVGMAQALERLVRAHDACLKSAPNHPVARKLRCGKGKYRLISFPVSGRYLCGLREAIAAIRDSSSSVPRCAASRVE